MRFLADMGVAPRVVAWLRSEGHDVWYLPEEGLQRLPDIEIFREAGAQDRIILTFDLDFSEIVALSQAMVSVVVFRTRLRRAPFVIERLGTVLRETGARLERGAVVTVEDLRHRVRPLPIER